ncbi:AAA family ATPase [Nonomuraea dietziae]|uniref:AAA family ATPase n=1 Tax=Nonomuraea dietziae TaxID=65515 RepID=UPI0033865E4A
MADVLDQVGLTDVASRRIGGFSLGMRQRLGIGAALLGDPGVLMLDEPLNGLDPEGIRWLRDLLRSLADEGRTVLLSSHLMNEMALSADHVIVIGRGRLIADTGMDALAGHFQGDVLVRTPLPERLAGVFARTRARGGHRGRRRPVGAGLDAARSGSWRCRRGSRWRTVSAGRVPGGGVSCGLTEDSTEYRTRAGPGPGTGHPEGDRR